MENTLLNKIIIITGLEQKVAANGNTWFRVKDNENKSYQLWKSKQDGTDSAAYQGLSALPNNGLNQSVEISYSEEQGEYQGKPVTYRRIALVKSKPLPAAMVVNNVAKTRIDNKDEAWGKCKHAYLVEAFRSNGSLGNLKMIEPIAEEWAGASMRRLKKEQVNIEDLGQEISVDEIPF